MHLPLCPTQCVDMSIDQDTYIHMKVYLDMNNVTFPTAANWRVNYVGYQVCGHTKVTVVAHPRSCCPSQLTFARCASSCVPLFLSPGGEL